MQSIRKRAPFQSTDDDPSGNEDNTILDEQEQEATIQTLKAENQLSNSRYLTALQIIITLSSVLQVFSLLHNPILAVLPPTTPDTTPEIPLPVPFTLFNILVHFNLILVAFQREIRSRNILSESALHPLPYQLSYAIAAVPPTLSMFLRKAWQSTAWWGVTFLMVFTVQTVSYAINEGNENISELEAMRYTAPGA